MAGRIRTIKPELLEDEKASALSDAAWRLFVSSWLLADDHGRFRAGAKYLAAQVWQDTGETEKASRALAELARVGRVRVYRVEGQAYAEIPTWARHQRIDNAGKPRIPAPDVAAFNDSEDLHVDSPRTSANVGESPRFAAKASEPAALPPTSDLRPPTTTGDPSGGSEAPSAPAPTRRVKASKGATLPGLQLEPAGPKPERPLETFWRVFRDAWAKHYGRPYCSSDADGKAAVSLAKLGVEMCSSLGRTEPGDLEALQRWRATKYLGDRGTVRGAGERGYLEVACHPVKDMARGLAAYGTPWDRPAAKASPLPAIAEPRRPAAAPLGANPRAPEGEPGLAGKVLLGAFGGRS